MTDVDDIPEALRDQPLRRASSQQSSGLLGMGLFGIGIVALAIALLGLRSIFQAKEPISSNPATPEVTPTPSPSVKANPTPTPTPVENVLGHLPYVEAPNSQLKAITSDGQIRLHQVAAEKFLQMQADARANGVILVPISGFRTVSQQEYLFFGVKEQRNQQTEKRAEVSAPPGYSEHHTGYAIDIGDGRSPGSNLSVSFENTAAFAWLQKNANRYSFELSFPPNNSQGISYEPWHWRYVGDRDSLETFYKAREINPSN